MFLYTHLTYRSSFHVRENMQLLTSFKKFLIRIYLLYRGDSLWQFQIGLYCILVRSPPLSLFLDHFPTPFKVIARVLFHISILSLSTIFPHLNLLHLPSHSQKYHPPHTIYCTYFTDLSFVVNIKSKFKGVSQCISAESILYFGPFNPFHYSSLPLYFPPHFSTAFNTCPYIFYLHRSFTILLMFYPSLFLSLLPWVP
jgi:hypothetical protein